MQKTGEPVETELIEFLVRKEVIRFGDFTLKSGRKSPYFINMGVLSDAYSLEKLGKFYAKKITSVYGENYDVVFGPAYKAIPIAISTVLSLKKDGVNKRWLFDRKEKKEHGADTSKTFVGAHKLKEGAEVIIVDDVFTTGETKIEAIEKLRKSLGAKVGGVLIAVDRLEKGKEKSATLEFTEKTGVRVDSLERIDNVFNYLYENEIDGKKFVNRGTYDSFLEYQKEFGTLQKGLK